MTDSEIQTFLRESVGDKMISVCRPRKGISDYEFAVFLSLMDCAIYKEGWDTESSFVIWKASHKDESDEYGFSYNVHDNGVRYHKDMSGTPPSDELVEYTKTFATLFECVEGLARFIFEQNLDLAKETYNVNH